MARQGGLAGWQNSLRFMEDDEDQDSDTDSKLSGSAIVDSVMKRLRKHGHYKDHSYLTGGELLDPIRDQSLSEQDEESDVPHSSPGRWSSEGRREPRTIDSGHRYGDRPALANGYQNHSPRSQRRVMAVHSGSPRQARRDLLLPTDPTTQMGGYFPQSRPNDRRKKEVLSPVPETSLSGARVVEVSGPGGSPPRKWTGGHVGGHVGGPGNYSLENLPHGTPPQRRREDRITGEMRAPYRQVTMESYSRSQEVLPQLQRDIDGTGSDIFSPYQSSRRSSFGSSTGIPATPNRQPGGGIPHSHSSSVVPLPNHGYGAVHIPTPAHNRNRSWHDTRLPSYETTRVGNHRPPYENVRVGERRTPPTKRTNYERREILSRDLPYHGTVLSDSSVSRFSDTSHDPLERAGSVARSDISQTREPNLNDVVDFLGSEDPGLVSNAASYLQHLAYGDDSMKAKIRQYGAIPVLVSQLRNPDTKVQLSILGALRNLSFGRSNEENKLEIAGEHGMQEIVLALKMSRMPEIRDLLTSVLWNLSSCEELKLRVIKLCLQDLVEHVLVPYSGWTAEAASNIATRPGPIQWNAELRNGTGTLRNVSSAGEPARVFMRSSSGLVDCLLWIVKAAVQQTHEDGVDEKTVENVVCILRNLSYHLENEIDPQEGAEDVLDREWEAEQRKEMDELQRSGRKPPGCFGFFGRPTNRTRARSPTMSRPIYSVDFANPDASALPRRKKSVYGMPLLWQPEVVYPYLALIEHYGSCSDTLEAAAGAIQNLTACSWKWAVYSRNIIRTSNGLRVLTELLNNGHDAVVKAAATALRNLAIDARNKASLGVLTMSSLIPRLPFGSNHLGISEPTTIALLCYLMELATASPENAKLFHDKEGIPYLTRLTRSRQHTTKVVFTANKVCSILYDYKDSKAALKREGWEMSQYTRQAKSMNQDNVVEFERGSMSQDYRGSGRKPKKESKKKRRSKKKSKKSENGGVKIEEVPSEGPQENSTAPTRPRPPQPLPPSYKIQDINEPGYIAVPDSEQQQPQVLSSSFPGPSSVPGPASPLAIYQTIQDAQSQNVTHSGRSETTAASTTSGPLSTTSQEEEPDPNATYAQVNIEKKRASRRQQQKEQQQQQPPPPGINIDSIDSWV